MKLGLIEHRIVAFHPSVWGTIEFRVVFEKLPASMSPDERRATQLASIPTFDDPVPEPPGARSASGPAVGADPAGGATAEGVVTIDVSTREQSLIEAKRCAIEKARSLVGRVRGRSPS